MAAKHALLQSEAKGIPCRRGKVRDVYDLGDRLVLVATDRVSAFDWVLSKGIPDKGKILTAITLFWFDLLGVENHLISTRVEDMGGEFFCNTEMFQGRSCLVKKTKVIPIECVARGYLAGTGWKEYQKTETVCGIPLPKGLKQSSRLPQPIFTPSTKAETGHDENISFEVMVGLVGEKTAQILKQRTLEIYSRAANFAETKGIILADTKFEWGVLPNGNIILIDEVLTPDSSRFWEKSTYAEGTNPASFDKQFIRDWLETTSWDKNSPPPDLPPDIIEQTQKRYWDAYSRLTGKTPF